MAKNSQITTSLNENVRSSLKFLLLLNKLVEQTY